MRTTRRPIVALVACVVAASFHYAHALTSSITQSPVTCGTNSVCPANCGVGYTSSKCSAGKATCTQCKTCSAHYSTGTSCGVGKGTKFVGKCNCACGSEPVDCVGAWVTSGSTQTYKISKNKNSCGKACPYANGATKSTGGTPGTPPGKPPATGGGTTCPPGQVNIGFGCGSPAPPSKSGIACTANKVCPANCGIGQVSSTCSNGKATCMTCKACSTRYSSGSNCGYNMGSTFVGSCNCACGTDRIDCVGGWTDTTACTLSGATCSKMQTFQITAAAKNCGTCPHVNGAKQTVACAASACSGASAKPPPSPVASAKPPPAPSTTTKSPPATAKSPPNPASVKKSPPPAPSDDESPLPSGSGGDPGGNTPTTIVVYDNVSQSWFANELDAALLIIGLIVGLYAIIAIMMRSTRPKR